MPSLRFVFGLGAVTSPEQKAGGLGELEAFPSETAARGDQTGRLPVAGVGAPEDSGIITVPHFEPELGDLDEDVAVAEMPTPSRPSKDKPRSRSGPLRILLTALVLLQAAPTFLWLRDRFAASTTRNAPPAVSTPMVAPPGVVAASREPTATVSRRETLPPKPVGTGSVAARKAAPASVAGRLSVAAPMPMQVYAKGKLIGSTASKTFVLAAGNHDLDFVNEDVGYRARRRVAVHAARTTHVRLDAPMGTLNINATPWAEVWLDNQHIGETPIGNFRAPIGEREVLFRHPEFGERRTTVLVTLKQPARVSMDFTQR